MEYFLKNNSDDRIYTGTVNGIAKAVIEAYHWKVVYSKEDDDDYYLAEVHDSNGDSLADAIADTDDGSDTAALESLYMQAITSFGDCIFCEISEAGCFLMDYDSVLDRITAREVRDNCLDPDDEREVREWCYYSGRKMVS